MLYIPYPFKKCTTCGLDFPANAKYFYRHKKERDGLRCTCKACSNIETRKYREQHPEKNKDYCNKWYRSNPDYVRNKTKEYAKRHSAKVSAYQKQYREAHRETSRRYLKAWRKRNPYKMRDYTYKWITNHPEEAKRSQQRRTRKYRQSHPDVMAELEGRRRARELSVNGSFNRSDIKRQYKAQRGKCYWCGCKLTKYHVDHVIPLSRGGSNGPENLVVACPPCNLSKGDKLPHEWKGNKGKLL